MAVEFNRSKTKENLMKAFAGESQARNRYTIAADTCKKQSMYAVGEIFLFTAEQERAHAQRYYDLLKELSGNTVEISGGFPVDHHDDVVKLLESAHHNEMEEYNDVYQAFGDEAKREGFLEAASAFYQIAEIEQIHAKRFAKLKEMLKSNTYFERSESGMWMCLNCGHIQKGKAVPPLCPVCRYDRGYFIPAEMAPYLELDFV